MKLHYAFVGLTFVAVLTSLSACYSRQKRSDWRSPALRAPCASDADCPGGSCVIELGASQGMCNPTLPVLPDANAGGADGGDAGDEGAPPAPVIQPSPNDIHI